MPVASPLLLHIVLWKKHKSRKCFSENLRQRRRHKKNNERVMRHESGRMKPDRIPSSDSSDPGVITPSDRFPYFTTRFWSGKLHHRFRMVHREHRLFTSERNVRTMNRTKFHLIASHVRSCRDFNDRSCTSITHVRGHKRSVSRRDDPARSETIPFPASFGPCEIIGHDLHRNPPLIQWTRKFTILWCCLLMYKNANTMPALYILSLQATWVRIMFPVTAKIPLIHGTSPFLGVKWKTDVFYRSQFFFARIRQN